MPIYAFECDACGHSFDRLQKLSDADPTDCPQCGAAQLRRQLTAPQFRLSGSGWYETDFKKDGDKKRNLSGDGGAAGAEAKSESKSDSKPGDSKSADSTTSASKAASSGSGSGAGDSQSKATTTKPVDAKPAVPTKSDAKPAG